MGMLFCDHDWSPRSGMDSGSICNRCGAQSPRECRPGSGLSDGELAPAKKGVGAAFGRLLCSHDWERAASGGSVCNRCGAQSPRECQPGSGLSDGSLLPKGHSAPGPWPESPAASERHGGDEAEPGETQGSQKPAFNPWRGGFKH